MPLGGEAKPLSKSAQLERGPKRPSRQKASKTRWAQIAEARQGPCLICGHAPPNELHHLIARSQGGADCEGNLVPLCQTDHALIEARDPIAGRMLAAALDDLSYAYVIEHFGESFFERRLGVVYARA